MSQAAPTASWLAIYRHLYSVMISAGPERGSGPSSLQVGSRSMPYCAGGAIAGQVVVLRSKILESVV